MTNFNKMYIMVLIDNFCGLDHYALTPPPTRMTQGINSLTEQLIIPIFSTLIIQRNDAFH